VHFADKLGETGMSVSALVVNRVQPRFADDALLAGVAAVAGAQADEAGATIESDDPSHRALDELVANLRGYTAASDREEQAYADLVAKVAPAPVFKVPLLETDVHDLSGLTAVCDLLFDRRGPSSGTPLASDAPPAGR
jgi:anion-transporting  ArsA/GET3 family ATPase